MYNFQVNTTGTTRCIVYKKEPVWALEQSFHTLKVIDYTPDGWTRLPTVYDLVKFNTRTVQVNDYFVLTGELVDEEATVEIDLIGKVFVGEPKPLKMIIR